MKSEVSYKNERKQVIQHNQRTRDKYYVIMGIAKTRHENSAGFAIEPLAEEMFETFPFLHGYSRRGRSGLLSQVWEDLPMRVIVLVRMWLDIDLPNFYGRASSRRRVWTAGSTVTSFRF